jgi:hypothetical protein
MLSPDMWLRNVTYKGNSADTTKYEPTTNYVNTTSHSYDAESRIIRVLDILEFALEVIEEYGEDGKDRLLSRLKEIEKIC